MAEEEKRGKGHPKAFKTEDDLKVAMLSYVAYCKKKKKMPNVAGFCVFCDINRDTYYAQKDYYSDTFSQLNDILEDETINTNCVSDSFKQFYMKNKFGYKDKQEIENSGAVDIKIEGYNPDFSK
jgi:hypothetical protein